MDIRLEIMREFEKEIKRILTEKFGMFLPENKISLLNNTIFATEALLSDMNTVEEMQGTIIRKNIDLLVDMKTTKDFTLEDGSVVSIPYGEEIENGIIEFYTKKISEEYGIHINEIPELQKDLNFIILIDQKLKDGLDPKAFSTDAIKLLDSEDIKGAVSAYDSLILNQYLERQKAFLEDDKTKDEEIELVEENTEREKSIQTVWIKERKNIKYIDPLGEVHLVDIEDSKNAQEYYEKSYAQLLPEKQMDPEEFYKGLLKILEEEKLTNTDDVKKQGLNYEELDMFAFIESNDNIRKQEAEDTVTHLQDQSIHVTESNDSIIVTEDKNGYVDAREIKDGEATTKDDSRKEDISSRLLTKEEFQALLEKSYNQELSKEEYESLRRACIYYSEEEKKTHVEEKTQEVGPVLKNATNNSGFTHKILPLYLSIIFVLAITIFIIYLMSK